MPAEPATPFRKRAGNFARESWLRKHADYQRVYREGKRQSLPLMTYFFAMRRQDGRAEHAAGSQEQVEEQSAKPPASAGSGLALPLLGSRIGLTAGRVLGNAVQRNRIKRRMREAVRQHRMELTHSVDVILHPRRTVLEADFAEIERDVLRALRAVEAATQAPREDWERLNATAVPSTASASPRRPGLRSG